MRKYLLSTLALIASVLNCFAADPALPLKGEGTEASPYLITNTTDFKALADACNGDASLTTGKDCGHYAGTYFRLTSDLDLASLENFRGIAAAPLGQTGTSTWNFAGIFDGDGHTISNMKCQGMVFDENGIAVTASKTGSRSYIGLFGALESGAIVKNLTLDASCTVTGWNYVGAIAGYIKANVKIENVVTYASVDGYQYVGGIGGYITATATTMGSIERCANFGTVRTLYQCGGGIAGYLRGKISNCANYGDVLLYGFNEYKPSGQSIGGGIAGQAYLFIIDNCLNAGRVKVNNDQAGGITGYATLNSSTGTLKDCVNLGMVDNIGGPTVGAIVGKNGSSTSTAATISGCVYDRQLRGEAAVAGTTHAGVDALSTQELIKGSLPSSLSTDYWAATPNNYPSLKSFSNMAANAATAYILFPNDEGANNFSTSATIPANVKASLKIGKGLSIDNNRLLITNNQSIIHDTLLLTNGFYTNYVAITTVPQKLFDGAGTISNPYLISTPRDIMLLAQLVGNDGNMHFADTHFAQTADIDMASLDDFIGIGGVRSSDYYLYKTYYFSGHYDGRGHKIKNMNLRGVKYASDGKAIAYSPTGSINYAGLFAILGPGALIENINIDSTCTVEGMSYVGSIAGYALDNSRISNVSSQATVKGIYNYVGGILGYGDAATNSVNCIVDHALFSGSVVGNNAYTGGIVGSMRGVIEDCVNIGDVSARNFNDYVKPGVQQTVGGITGSAACHLIRCANYGPVYAEATKAGGIAGETTGAMGRGNIINCFNAGTVVAIDTITSGAVVGNRITSVSGSVTYGGNYFDNQLNHFRSVNNAELDGMLGVPTAYLTNTNPLPGYDSIYSFAANRYPVPTPFANNADVLAAAQLVVVFADGESKDNAKSTAKILAPSASLANGSAFKIDNSNGTLSLIAPAVTEITTDTLILSSNSFTRQIPVTALPRVLAGSGSQADPWIIKSADDFLTMAAFMNNSRHEYNREYITVTSDLDFTGKPFVTAGSKEIRFGGFFNGNGHKISGIKMEIDSTAMPIDVAMFGGVSAYGLISNLHFSDCAFVGYGNVACITSHLDGTIRNCSADSTVSVLALASSSRSGNNAATMAACYYAGSSISDCYSYATVTANTVAGGIAGFGNSTSASLVNLKNYGPITGSSPYKIITDPTTGTKQVEYPEVETGGVVGRLTGSAFNLENYGAVTASVCMGAGGVVGKMMSGATLRNAVNNGSVFAQNRAAAGIVGTTGNSTTVKSYIDSCFNYGTVNSLAQIGGIVGDIGSNFVVTNCGNTADMKPTFGVAGGIAAYSSYGYQTITDCWNTGEISGTARTGGIMGTSEGAMITINRCINTGNVFAGVAGGMGAGIANGPVTISDCINTGNISGTKLIGGIAGNATAGSITHCLNLGTVSCSNASALYGNIDGANVEAVQLSANYYLDELPKGTVDTRKGVDEANAEGLFDGQDLLGNAFTYTEGAFPRISSLAHLDISKTAAAWIVSSHDELTSDLKHNFNLTSLPGLTWSAQGPIEINGSKVTITGTGNASLTATTGNHSKTIPLKVTLTNAVDNTSVETPVNITYFTLDGLEVQTPVAGTTLIKVSTYPSGHTKAEKTMIP